MVASADLERGDLGGIDVVPAGDHAAVEVSPAGPGRRFARSFKYATSGRASGGTCESSHTTCTAAASPAIAVSY
jgi:hypothetical protein